MPPPFLFFSLLSICLIFTLYAYVAIFFVIIFRHRFRVVIFCLLYFSPDAIFAATRAKV